jgi:hypothetical protein
MPLVVYVGICGFPIWHHWNLAFYTVNAKWSFTRWKINGGALYPYFPRFQHNWSSEKKTDT